MMAPAAISLVAEAHGPNVALDLGSGAKCSGERPDGDETGEKRHIIPARAGS
jgi:hypothetical protein